MTNTYWNIDDGNGNSLTQGMQNEIVARRAAQAHANRLGRSVFLYEAGSPVDGEGEPDTSIEPEEIAPE